jgi:protein-S-isoprenylcysteine O-methyltransferase Ste14
MTWLICFALATLLLAAVSWRSLRHNRSHGFARFFAWEALAGLLLLNLPYWFRDPFSPLQILSWVTLFVALFLVLHSVWLLRQVKQAPDAASPEAPAPAAPTPDLPGNYAFENTARLVTKGAYAYIRHPMYSSLLWLGVGICLKHLSLQSVLLLAAVVVFLYWTARLEESENLARFGSGYQEYMRKTKRFIPFLF